MLLFGSIGVQYKALQCSAFVFLNRYLRRFAEFLRYFLVSGVALLVDATGLFALVEGVGVHYRIAAVISFVIGAGVSFFLSSAWAFKVRAFDDWRRGFVVFLLIGCIGLIFSLGVLSAWVDWLALPYMQGKAVAAIFCFSINFSLRKIMLFSIRVGRT